MSYHTVTHIPEWWCACTCTCGWIAIHTGGPATCARIAHEHLTTETENTPMTATNTVQDEHNKRAYQRYLAARRKRLARHQTPARAGEQQ